MNREKLRSRIRRSRQARLGLLVRSVDELDTMLTALDEGEGIPRESMQRARDLVSHITQSFHEYNAYRNAEEVFAPSAPSSAGSEHRVPDPKVEGSNPSERAT